MSAVWMLLALAGLALLCLAFETWTNGKITIEQEKTRQAEIDAKAGKVKP